MRPKKSQKSSQEARRNTQKHPRSAQNACKAIFDSQQFISQKPRFPVGIHLFLRVGSPVWELQIFIIRPENERKTTSTEQKGSKERTRTARSDKARPKRAQKEGRKVRARHRFQADLELQNGPPRGAQKHQRQPKPQNACKTQERLNTLIRPSSTQILRIHENHLFLQKIQVFEVRKVSLGAQIRSSEGRKREVDDLEEAEGKLREKKNSGKK